MDIKKLKNFYKDKKVFVTGHTGFKGTWLCLFLDYLGAKIIGYSLKPNYHDNYLFYKSIDMHPAHLFWGPTALTHRQEHVI